jgi:WD40 repeat protein
MKFARLAGSALVVALACTASGAADEPRVDRFGDPLPAGALLRLGTSRFRHDGTIYSIAYSPDGRLLVTGNAGYRSLMQDASVVVWDAESGKRLRTWYGHAHVVRCVAISHDNRHVAVVNGYGHFHLYDITTGKEPRRFEIENPGQAAFTPDGQLLVTDGIKVRRWELASGKELPAVTRSAKGGVGMAVAADGKTIATYTREGDVRIYNVDGSERSRIALATKGMVASLSPDGKQLACGTFDEVVHVFDTVTGKLQWRTDPAAKGVNWRLSAAAFSPDGRVLVGSDQGLTLWDTATGKVLRQVSRPYGSTHHAHFAPDGKRIVTAGNEASPRFWEADTLKETLRYEGHQHAVRVAVFTTDGKELATVSDENFVHFWDLATGRARAMAEGQQAVIHIALARTGNVLATSRSHEWPELWDMRTGKPIAKLRPKSSEMGGGTVQLTADGKKLAAGTGYSAVRFWDVATGEESPTACKGEIAPTGGDLTHYLRFVLAPDGKTLAATRNQLVDSGVVLWDAVKGTPRLKLADRGEPGAFAPDGRLVAILDGKEVRLLDTATGAVARRIVGNGVRVLAAAFSPDGRTLAIGGVERTVSLWEVATGQLRARRTGHDAAVDCVAFAPDGRRLASGGDDHTVLIWDLADGVTPGPLTAKVRDALWTSLAGVDAAAAYQAIWRLAGDPQSVVPFLKGQLRPLAPADSKLVARLIAMLDSDDFTEREQANGQLAELAELAETGLRQTLKQGGSIEQRRRIENLLHRLETLPPSPEQLRHLRSIEVLEHAHSDDARQLLENLAAGAPEARLTRDARAALSRQ